MSLSKFKFVSALLLMSLLSTHLLGQLPMQQKVVDERVSGSSSIREILDHRSAQIDALQKTLEGEIDPMKRCEAMYLAGELHAERLSVQLAKEISYEAPLYRDDSGHSGAILWSKYPASEALLKIGIDAIPSLLSNLADVGEGPVFVQSLWCLRSIMNVSLNGHGKYVDGFEVSADILRRAAESEPNVEKRGRLEKASAKLLEMKSLNR